MNDDSISLRFGAVNLTSFSWLFNYFSSFVVLDKKMTLKKWVLSYFVSSFSFNTLKLIFAAWFIIDFSFLTFFISLAGNASKSTLTIKVHMRLLKSVHLLNVFRFMNKQSGTSTIYKLMHFANPHKSCFIFWALNCKRFEQPWNAFPFISCTFGNDAFWSNLQFMNAFLPINST